MDQDDTGTPDSYIPGMSGRSPIHVIGGGLAGCEAAWQSARAGVPAVIHEMRPERGTDAHITGRLAELVCSNSFRSDDTENNAVGLLHEEMRRAGSLIMRAADARRVPAGSALAVDRAGFSDVVESAMAAEPLINIDRHEVSDLPAEDRDPTIIATGPLTSPGLAAAIQSLTGEDSLAFFDAISPIVYRDSIDFSKAWYQSRYDKGDPEGGGDYINCPLDRAQYESLIAAFLGADKIEFKEWEAITPYFEGCLPIEIMAERGVDTLRYGPMKPVGLTDPRTGERPHAVVQLRQDNALGTPLQHRGGSRPSCATPSSGASSVLSRASKTHTSRASAACTATPSSIARGSWIRSSDSRPCRVSGSPDKSPASKATWRAPRSACWQAVLPRRK